MMEFPSSLPESHWIPCLSWSHLAQSGEAELKQEGENLHQIHAPGLQGTRQTELAHNGGGQAEKPGLRQRTAPSSPHLSRLEVLQHEVPELGRGVQQQELKAGRRDAGRFSRLTAEEEGKAQTSGRGA